MNGGHYIRGIRGMAIISAVLYSLLLDQFLIEIDQNTQNQVVQQVKGISQLISETNNQSTNTEWQKLTTKMKSLGFDEFNENRKKKSAQFLFSQNFISKDFPVLRGLTRSHREGDQKLHLSAIQRVLPLVFALDRTNYKWWLPLYFEDCLSLPKKYLSIHESFFHGDFVVRLTQRNVSDISMDQALESKYNKPAKLAPGIIGITCRKAAVGKWHLIKHEKSTILTFSDKCQGSAMKTIILYTTSFLNSAQKPIYSVSNNLLHV